MSSLTKHDSTPSIKTPQELVHIKHRISLRQYKYWILALRAYREDYEAGVSADESGFHRISIAQLSDLIGYEPVRAELRSDLEAIRKEAIIYNVLGKDGKPAQRGAGFISEWEVSAHWIGFKLPSFLAECVERLDLKNAMFQALNWAVFNSFSGKYEAILYKLCKDYAGVRRTPQMDIKTFREYMGLKETEYAEFKDLNKFVISGPIKKINESEIADITIEAEFSKESRRVVGVQFIVTPRLQSAFSFENNPVFANARVTIPWMQQQTYLASASADDIIMAIERANDYAADKEAKGESVNLGAIYKTAITQGWGAEYRARKAEELKKTLPPKVTKEEPVAPDPARLKAMADFEALPLADQRRKLQLFELDLQEPLLSTFRKQGLGSVLVRKALEGWLSKR
jgi:hypothetical protein